MNARVSYLAHGPPACRGAARRDLISRLKASSAGSACRIVFNTARSLWSHWPEGLSQFRRRPSGVLSARRSGPSPVTPSGAQNRGSAWVLEWSHHLKESIAVAAETPAFNFLWPIPTWGGPADWSLTAGKV